MGVSRYLFATAFVAVWMAIGFELSRIPKPRQELAPAFQAFGLAISALTPIHWAPTLQATRPTDRCGFFADLQKLEYRRIHALQQTRFRSPRDSFGLVRLYADRLRLHRQRGDQAHS